MNNLLAILLTLIVGLSFIIGILITKFTTKKKELTLFATGMSFAVMLGMIMIDIIPEIGENIREYPNNEKWLIIIIFTFIGMGLLKGLDSLIPHHNHNHKEQEKNKKEHNDHLFHIGFVTSISLILHNILEGISIYITAITNMNLGLMMALAVSLHNIPLGIEISAGMNATKSKEKIKRMIITLLMLSSFIGAFLLFLFKIKLNSFLICALLCTTFGMLIYIALFELLKEIWCYRKNKVTYYGILTGLVIGILMVVL